MRCLKREIKIGGLPFWVQKPVSWTCSCGADMEFLCQVPGNMRFSRAEGSPRQPNVYSEGHHLEIALLKLAHISG